MFERLEKKGRSYRWPSAAAITVAAALALASNGLAGDEQAARRTVHLLQYIAADYPSAVEAGTIASQLEYQEQIEFIGQVASELRQLGIGDDDPLAARLAELSSAIRDLGPQALVQSTARELAEKVHLRFGVAALPPRVPSIARGRIVYMEACAACHGLEGRGDGERAHQFDPSPTDFTDRRRALALSPWAAYNTITLGIDGTAMASFADAFDDATRYDLAFFVSSLSFTPAEVASGRVLRERDDGQLPSIAELVTRPAAVLGGDSDKMAVVAFLRTHPEALYQSDSALALARQRLAASWSALAEDSRKRATNLAVSAYLDGFEQIETLLDTVDHELRLGIEADFVAYRAAIGRGDDVAAAAPAYLALLDGLGRAEQRLESGALGFAALFTSALTIIAREGAEAVLIIAALCAIVVRSSQRNALRYIHAGWSTALVAGAATWLVTREMLELSGAGREVIEGLASLLASAVLFYVSYWLIAKVSAQRWQRLLQDKVTTALSGGSLWVLAVISFVAVYREMLETVLFFTALRAQAGADAARPILLGASSGSAFVVLLTVVIFRLGLRLPLRTFFRGSSVLLSVLAIVLAGQGVAALQEAQWLPSTPIEMVCIDWLGIYPTLEGMVLQSLIVVACLAATVVLATNSQRTPSPSPPPTA